MQSPPDTLLELIGRFTVRARAAGWDTPSGAYGACLNASGYFARLCRDAGLDAASYGSWAHELLVGYPHGPRALGDGHVVCAVTLTDGPVTVDWTAAQYGVTDPFPVIGRWPDGLPTRDQPWLLSAAEARELMDQLRAELEHVTG